MYCVYWSVQAIPTYRVDWLYDSIVKFYGTCVNASNHSLVCGPGLNMSCWVVRNRHFCPTFDVIRNRVWAALATKVAKEHTQFWCMLIPGLRPYLVETMSHPSFVPRYRNSSIRHRQRLEERLITAVVRESIAYCIAITVLSRCHTHVWDCHVYAHVWAINKSTIRAKDEWKVF